MPYTHRRRSTMLTVLVILAVLALLCAVASFATARVPLGVAVILLCVISLLQVLPVAR